MDASGPERERERRAGEAASAAPAAEARPAAAAAELASAIGNRNFSRVIARMGDGDGILPGARVHPQVEAAISAARGRGAPLAPHTAGRLESAFGEPVDDVRVHTGVEAAALARAVSARAFTVGSDIFFAHGEYRPDTADGFELVSHEAHHTRQQRGAPASGPLTVSSPGDPLEVEAESVARDAGG